MKSILGIKYYFSELDYNDAVFMPERSSEPFYGFLQRFKRWMEEHYEVEVHTYNCVDPMSDDVKAVLYFDYSIVGDMLGMMLFFKECRLRSEP